ncbi:CheR family methyltransferase [Sporomusa acidovorans]|uniref:protein-glutamate O-methyltransferase n=1 Tax=Sporomusa acidovorans (strain ATCC 49682 / DSM 3132 / Mol) TaxID=1123286 RepID=A0ABZ3J918_SPOA4|nr:protein-glutamate O-methyltransferase CheR [Sporomusa acidovorans]OZC16637.1 chemotaxis protein methyltransferase [Sporomusa acidovorans DSM 3132]SDE07556.1 MCP methyltransferase, CheR-type [Sporomusa acidovorans]
MIGIDEQEFRQLADFIHANYGINLGNEKKQLLLGRLQGVLVKKNIGSFTEYYQQIMADKSGSEVATLLDRITTNHTFFLRENQHFEYLRSQVLPYLSATVRDKDLRIWSAGCASGQEAYTIAMLLADAFDGTPGWNKVILATDIASRVLEKAVSGIYQNNELTGLPPAWEKKYFEKRNESERTVRRSIQSEIIFRKFNLMEPVFPFKKKFHVIFCRNVMIYFDHQTKRELIGKFFNFTEPGGYLFVGHSESLHRGESGYDYIAPGIYRKPGGGGYCDPKKDKSFNCR